MLYDTMKAAVTLQSNSFAIGNHRREKHFNNSYSVIALIAGEEMREIITARLYVTQAQHSCCVWVHAGDVHVSGGGKAGGYGYHRASAALQEALNAAGIYLNQDIDGRGDNAMVAALEAIAQALGYSKVKVFQAHA